MKKNYIPKPLLETKVRNILEKEHLHQNILVLDEEDDSEEDGTIPFELRFVHSWGSSAVFFTVDNEKITVYPFRYSVHTLDIIKDTDEMAINFNHTMGALKRIAKELDLCFVEKGE